MSMQTSQTINGDVYEKTAPQQSYPKRVLDIVLSGAALIFLSPMFLFLALCVLVTLGRPVIFRHPRLGLNGKTFRCLKFRSMVRDADVVLERYLAENPEAAREWAEQYKLRRDPRIKGLGHFLRRTSFDELPQLINILVGDMSLVGPRPIVPDELERYGDRAGQLLSVRPGLTGLWQVSGRNNLSREMQVALDIHYIQHWSFVGDLKIIARTVPAVLTQRGAM
jgi:exopolysaccharide production protein ExoY